MESLDEGFDGVICFGGGDWWYHNRGHYDMQMCRELSASMPVLYVNSVGIRVPKLTEGSMFVRRIGRKLASLRRGFVRVRDNFAVMSPISIPGRTAMGLSRRLLVPQVLAGARRMGIRRPLVWVTCPPGADALEGLKPAGVVYQRTDRWESFPEADPEMIVGFHKRLQKRADVTLFCSTVLFEEEASECRNAAYVDHGVDFENFVDVGLGKTEEPEDLAGIPRPRAGFVGGIDALTFDEPLFSAVATQLSDVQFVLVGNNTLGQDWSEFPNVTLLGQKPYPEVPAYMAGCDVLLMPWNRSEWIRACNPVKLKEYLAVGRPVVSTSFDELKHYEGYVHVGDGAIEFAGAIRQALEDSEGPERLRERVRGHTWAEKAQRVIEYLDASGIKPFKRGSDVESAPTAPS